MLVGLTTSEDIGPVLSHLLLSHFYFLIKPIFQNDLESMLRPSSLRYSLMNYDIITSPPPKKKSFCFVWGHSDLAGSPSNWAQRSWVPKKKQKYFIFLIHWELLLKSDILAFNLQSNSHFYTLLILRKTCQISLTWHEMHVINQTEKLYSPLPWIKYCWRGRQTERQRQKESQRVCACLEDLCVLGGLLFSVIPSLFLLQLDNSSIFCPSMILCMCVCMCETPNKVSASILFRHNYLYSHKKWTLRSMQEILQGKSWQP